MGFVLVYPYSVLPWTAIYVLGILDWPSNFVFWPFFHLFCHYVLTSGDFLDFISLPFCWVFYICFYIFDLEELLAILWCLFLYHFILYLFHGYNFLSLWEVLLKYSFFFIVSFKLYCCFFHLRSFSQMPSDHYLFILKDETLKTHRKFFLCMGLVSCWLTEEELVEPFPRWNPAVKVYSSPLRGPG